MKYKLIAQKINIGYVCIIDKKQVRWIEPFNFLINKNTPVGEPPLYYERKPYNGKKPIREEDILGEIDKNHEFEINNCSMTENRLQLITKICKSNSIKISKKLFHNGSILTTIDQPFKTLQDRLKENE